MKFNYIPTAKFFVKMQSINSHHFKESETTYNFFDVILTVHRR